jgi:hypothetical protein
MGGQGHMSCGWFQTDVDNPGVEANLAKQWFQGSMYDTGTGRLIENFACNTARCDGSDWRRYCFAQTAGAPPYYEYTWFQLSSDGLLGAFNSNMGSAGAGNGSNGQVFVVEPPTKVV